MFSNNVFVILALVSGYFIISKKELKKYCTPCNILLGSLVFIMIYKFMNISPFCTMDPNPTTPYMTIEDYFSFRQYGRGGITNLQEAEIELRDVYKGLCDTCTGIDFDNPRWIYMHDGEYNSCENILTDNTVNCNVLGVDGTSGYQSCPISCGTPEEDIIDRCNETPNCIDSIHDRQEISMGSDRDFPCHHPLHSQSEIISVPTKNPPKMPCRGSHC